MYVYKITNKVNNKVYIGQSIRPIEERFNRHINDAVNNVLDTHFARAIRKYGKENFTIELIDTAKTQEELTLKESKWISFYDSTKNGYNETDAITKCGGNTYKSKTEEEMRLISEKLKRSKLGSKNPNARGVKCFNVVTGEELFFDAFVDCQNYFNEKNHRFITIRVQEQTKLLYNGTWKIAYKDSGYYTSETNIRRAGRSVKVLNINSGESYIFKSIRETARELSINRGQLTKQSKETNHFVFGCYEFFIN